MTARSPIALHCKRNLLRFFGSADRLDDVGMEQTLRIHVAGYVYTLTDQQFWA
jgi:hypothetical protein